MHPAALTSPCGVRSIRANDVQASDRKPRRMTRNGEPMPNARQPAGWSSMRSPFAERGQGDPGTDLGHEALVPESALA